MERRRGSELQFLPALQELQETPPAPLGRALAGVIMALFTAAVAWAWLGHMDIVAVARGEVVPSGRTKVIQPLEAGVVRAIHVADGDRVAAGRVLVELDATAAAADAARLGAEAKALRVRVARLRALLDGRERLAPVAGADPEVVRVQRGLLRAQRGEFRARLASARLGVEQQAAALAVTEAGIRRLEALLPLVAERAAALEAMVDGGYGSRVEFLELEEERVDRQRELQVLRRRRERDRAALADAREQVKAVTFEARRAWRARLGEHRARLEALAGELAKARERRRRRRLRAPIDGTVQQLAVHTVGGVVTPAQTLMVVVPEGATLEVRARVENRDAGFVVEGQRAEVKVEAFPFTRYGTLAGTVAGLSRAAVPTEGGALAYSARVALADTALEVGGRRVAIAPGMHVSVEIKTGRRRLLEYFLSPLLRGLRETARER